MILEFNLDYPSFQNEIDIVKATTSDLQIKASSIFAADEIAGIQQLLRRIPVADNVVEYAVQLTANTRPGQENKHDLVNKYVDWGAGPRASQNLILAAKTHAAVNGKFSPDIENVQAVAIPILRHRVIRNYKSEAEGISENVIIQSIF